MLESRSIIATLSGDLRLSAEGHVIVPNVKPGCTLASWEASFWMLNTLSLSAEFPHNITLHDIKE